MSFKQKEVNLSVGQVVKEHWGLAKIGGVEGESFIPNTPIKYTVQVNGKDMKLPSVNQKFVPNTNATVMLDGQGKGELMYDKIGFIMPPFVMTEEKYAEFFGTALHNGELKVNHYSKKFKLFGGSTKKMEKAMEAGQAGTRVEALVIKRETGMETQVMNNIGISTKLTLLVKNAHEFFITEGKYKIKFNQKHGFDNFLIEAATTAVGMPVDVIFDPGNPSCTIVYPKGVI